MWHRRQEITWWARKALHIIIGIIFFVPFMVAMYMVSKENDL